MTATTSVWIVSLEWNFPSSEVTGDTGLVGAYESEADAHAAAAAERREHDEQGEQVYNYSMVSGTYCIACGEREAGHTCQNPFPEDAEEFCDCCGAELGANNSCDNDHDAWDIDVHVTNLPVQARREQPVSA